MKSVGQISDRRDHLWIDQFVLRVDQPWSDFGCSADLPRPDCLARFLVVLLNSDRQFGYHHQQRYHHLGFACVDEVQRERFAVRFGLIHRFHQHRIFQSSSVQVVEPKDQLVGRSAGHRLACLTIRRCSEGKRGSDQAKICHLFSSALTNR